MKLWDIIATCLLLLSFVSTRPLIHKLQPSKRAVASERRSKPLALDPLIDSPPEATDLTQAFMEEQYDVNDFFPEQFEDVMGLIEATIGRLRRSPESEGPSQAKREKSRQRGATNSERSTLGRVYRRKSRGWGGSRGGKESRDEKVKGPGHACLLKEIHLNVTDLGLGYRTKEELIFRYCSGPCYDSETNYDKILNNLTHNKKLDKDTPFRTCCRPIAFDNDISFLDDSLEYHTLKKHSAKKCACV